MQVTRLGSPRSAWRCTITNHDLRPARLAHLKGQGLIDIELETGLDLKNSLVYGLRPKRGVFVCEPCVGQGELELLWGKELTFVGYGKSELGVYSLSAEVYLADRAAFPYVTLRVVSLSESRVREDLRSTLVT